MISRADQPISGSTPPGSNPDQRASAFDQAVAASALQQVLAAGGIDGAARFDDGPPALDTRFRIAEGSSAALAAGGVAAARLAALRGQNGGEVAVDPRHAEESLRSYSHISFDDPASAAAMQRTRALEPGYHPTADGRWFFLHPAFPHNTEGLMELLGTDQPADLPDAVARWDGLELERAVAERGLCSAMARSAAEWDDSLPGRTLNTRPVVDIVQIGDTEPIELPTSGDRPLSGIEVLDLTRILAGPTCARTLASFGASATRIGSQALPSIPLFTVDTGFGKRSRFLDLAGDEGRSGLRAMLADADVFSQGYRTGAMDRLGFGPADVAAIRPGIVYVSINCYGHEGSWRTRPGWEQLAQTVTGMGLEHGLSHNDGVPALQPAAVTDYTTGYLAAYGAMVALARRAESGGSYWVRVSLARTAVYYRSLGLRQTVEATPVEGAELDAMRSVTDTSWGPVHHLKPVVRLGRNGDEVVRWDLPPVPLGSSR